MQGKFVAINYLNCPGFSDTPREVDALVRFLGKHPIHMIQWRNLNFDPIRPQKLKRPFSCVVKLLSGCVQSTNCFHLSLRRTNIRSHQMQHQPLCRQLV